LEAVLDDPNIDQTLVILTPQSMTDIESIARGICKFHETATKPMACSFMGAADVGPGIRLLQQAQIPHYILPEWACEAMSCVQRIRQWREQAMTALEPLPVDRRAAAAIIESAPAGYLDEDRALAVLEAYGMPAPKYKLCRTADEAAAFADEISYPVVVRVVSPQIIHKSEVQGIVLDLGDAGEVREAFEAIRRRAGQLAPGAEIRGMLVRRMIPPGYELILGAKRDPAFGPTLMFGLGGIYVELFGDVTFGLAPLDRATAGRMIRQVKAFKLLEGARGKPPADVASIEEFLVRLGQLAADFERIAELDINPLIAGPAERGSFVADVRIRLA
jgi:acetate---CoA ligase (ADP-forming)